MRTSSSSRRTRTRRGPGGSTFAMFDNHHHGAAHVSVYLAAPPEVHIRIGRIEVRSPQVVQAARSAPAELRPTLSLAGVLAGAKGK